MCVAMYHAGCEVAGATKHKLSRETKKMLARLLREAGMTYRFIARELNMSFSDIAEVSKSIHKPDKKVLDLPVILKEIRDGVVELRRRTDCIVRTFGYNRLPVWCANCRAYAKLVYDKKKGAWVCPMCGKSPF